MKINRYTESLEYNLEATARVLQEAVSVKFKELNFGISYDEFIILDEILHTPGILQIELAKRILKGRAYTGKFLIALEEKGYIERRTAIKGKRQVVMPNYITEEGIKVHKIAVQTVKDFDADILGATREDLQPIMFFLKTLKNNIEEKYRVKFL
ncbi:MAG: MarR family transcriptional regulator [Candidatus Gastranaerophilales bacterium]|nr:MarR family transcriptional regulator [Candidatus Gastranaerophilales bacterium]